MKIKKDFEIVEIADEFLAVPVGEATSLFHGIVVLNNETAFLLKAMHRDISQEELSKLLVDEYDVDFDTAMKDVGNMLESLKELEIIED